MSKFKDFFRKRIVSLKRRPDRIPMIVLVLAFLVFSLNLTHMSDATAKIQGGGMGLAEFTIMLLSMLSIVCLMNAFPRRKKPNIPMIVVMFVMFAVMIFCDIHYRSCIWAAVTRPDNPILLDANTAYISSAYNLLQTHMILIIVTAVLVVTLPVYSKWIRKINTSVEIEDNGSMDVIEINE